jgi:hypothetical protein
LEFSSTSNITQSNAGTLFSHFQIFNGSFNPAHRGFVTVLSSVGQVRNIRPATIDDFTRDVMNWNFNLCDFSLFSTFKSSCNGTAMLTSSGPTSIVFRSVPWLLPQVDSFSPVNGYKRAASSF